MIAKLEKIAGQLALADVEEAIDLRNKASAIAHYSKTQKACREIERSAIVIRLRCERRLGQLLARVHAGNPNCKPGGQLPEGISRNQSSQWQLVAKVPEKDFEEYLEGTKPTTKGLVKLAVEHRRERDNAEGPDSGGKILTGDMWQLHSRLEDRSVDLFLTDPPYADLECYSKLAELAATKLKPGGLCLAYSGQYHLPEVMQRLGEHLDYWWMIALQYSSSHTAVHPRKVQSAWKPILVYGSGGAWFTDLLRGGGREKANHDWEQPECECGYLIRKLTGPGALVVDPFCGSGTVLAAAKKLGRNYLGCELNGNTARGARRRLAA